MLAVVHSASYPPGKANNSRSVHTKSEEHESNVSSVDSLVRLSLVSPVSLAIPLKGVPEELHAFDLRQAASK